MALVDLNHLIFTPMPSLNCRSQGSNRRLYDSLIERVFRAEEKKNDSRVGKADIDALEKEISIDIADLRRDIRNLRRDMKLPGSKPSLGARPSNTLRAQRQEEAVRQSRKISQALQLPDLSDMEDVCWSRRSSGSHLSRKRSHVEATSRENLDVDSRAGDTDAEDQQQAVAVKKRPLVLTESISFKLDEDPEVVRHLVQTLGLLGTDSLDLDSRASIRIERKRHNSRV